MLHAAANVLQAFTLSQRATLHTGHVNCELTSLQRTNAAATPECNCNCSIYCCSCCLVFCCFCSAALMHAGHKRLPVVPCASYLPLVWRRRGHIRDCRDPRRWRDICPCRSWIGNVLELSFCPRPRRPAARVECAPSPPSCCCCFDCDCLLLLLLYSICCWRGVPRRVKQRRVYKSFVVCRLSRLTMCLCLSFVVAKFQFRPALV